MSQSTRQFVTVERFDAAIDALHARIDTVRTELSARIDNLRAELRADLWHGILIAVGVLIAANALMMTVLGIVLGRGTGAVISL